MKISKTEIGFIALIVVIVVVFSAVYFLPGKSTPQPVAVTNVDPTTLAGIQETPAPWPAEISHLSDRLTAIGLPQLTSEGSALHIHQHIDIIVDGKPVAVPAGAGINESARFISDVHVHDDTGIIHVESPTIETFTLGQFFDIWGVRFTSDCIGSYCNTKDNTLRVYSNGTLVSGDPRALPLTAHQEIAIVYGTQKEIPVKIPSTYTFPDGD